MIRFMIVNSRQIVVRGFVYVSPIGMTLMRRNRSSHFTHSHLLFVSLKQIVFVIKLIRFLINTNILSFNYILFVSNNYYIIFSVFF